MYRTLIGLLATLAAALFLVGLSFSASIGKPANVRFVNGTEPDTLDPQLLTGQPGGRIVTAIFEGLTRHDAKTLGPAPGVAKAWDISDDGLRYTFHLRDDSRWSDGVKLTAADFVYSWRRMLDPKLGAEYAYMLHPVKGAKALNTFDGLAQTIETSLVPALSDELKKAPPAGLTGDAWRSLLTRLPLHDSLQNSEAPELRGLLDQAPEPKLPEGSAGEKPAPWAVSRERLSAFVDALSREAERLRQVARDVGSRFGVSLGVYAAGEHTLIVELEAPTPYFLDITSFYSALPVPRHVVEKHGSAWFLPEALVSNGPFELTSWRVNDRIRLSRSEHYWGKSEVLAEIIDALPTENTTTALNLYLTGEAEWLPAAYPADLVEQLRPRPDFYMHAAFTVYYYRFNTDRPPLNDARVRQALNLAVDRPLIAEQVLGLGQLPAMHFVPPGVPGYDQPPSGISLNVERARQLLTAAGFPGGKGFPPIGILYNTLEVHKKIAEVVADQLKQNLGIQVTPYNQEWQSYLATVRAGSYDLARAAWIGDYLDPNTFLDMWVTNGGNNQTGFSSPTYDSIIRAAANMDGFARRPEVLLPRLKDQAAIARLLELRSASTDTRQRLGWLDQARMRLLAEAEAILVQDEFPIMPIYFYVWSGLAAPGLRGLYTELELPDGRRVPNLQGIHPLRDLWFDSSQR
jgi:oligopeptide transport system substrate-binding protein